MFISAERELCKLPKVRKASNIDKQQVFIAGNVIFTNGFIVRIRDPLSTTAALEDVGPMTWELTLIRIGMTQMISLTRQPIEGQAASLINEQQQRGCSKSAMMLVPLVSWFAGAEIKGTMLLQEQQA